ncbi:DNA-directed RNA polymerase subunit omega [Kocuria tytonicola]|uniref:DNA-directed RNA polymerase subunit omega n=1 Tax=Kocuria tytonicola TaxID=2055946 RepID=A0A3L9LDF9_9MICC|nr:DNA-directed RNA polymerase subunit omega [Kocuria tytonicola]RLY94987.1 DNA-directed RNA polymerase subunit omega [Kocuria tytonicola]RLZ03370.1 DNA-directed RNA polymerase subunit omega [Kocuria tytonicola]
MSTNNEGIVNPPVDRLLDKTDSKYGLVIFGARRARQINAYYSQLHEGLFEYVGPLVDTQLNEKPLSIAFREIDEGLIEADHIAHAGFTPNGQLISDEPTATDMFTGDFFAQAQEQDGTAVFSDGVELSETATTEDADAVSAEATTETAAEESPEASAESSEQ